MILINQEPFVLASISDITDRKRAEEALKKSEERNRQVLENANEAIFVVQDETIIFNNPKTMEISGY
jgi:PAS domain-containing protein